MTSEDENYSYHVLYLPTDCEHGQDRKKTDRNFFDSYFCKYL